MDKSTAELTVEYIKEHPHVKHCLKKGLINYSALARLISRELRLEKSSSKEAILVAARRYKETLKQETSAEDRIKDLMRGSEIEIRNRISVIILSKGINTEKLAEIQVKAKKENGTILVAEGSMSYTVIMQEKYVEHFQNAFANGVLKRKKGLAMVILKSSPEIEHTPGVVAFLASLFA